MCAVNNSTVIHCIHNPSRKDRFTLLQSEIREQNLSVVYWPAIIDPMIVFRGVSNAHKQIVLYAKANGLKEICIGEDDMKFLGKGAFEYFVNNKPEDYDLYLANIFAGNISDDNTVDNFAGLTLYFINERFYDKFLSSDELKHLDRAMEDHKGKYVVCNPMVTSQHSGWSENKKSWGEYDEYLHNYKLFGR